MAPAIKTKKVVVEKDEESGVMRTEVRFVSSAERVEMSKFDISVSGGNRKPLTL